MISTDARPTTWTILRHGNSPLLEVHMSDTPALLTGVSFVQEFMAAVSLPGASVLGKAVDNALEKRKRAAIDVLLGMIEAGKAEDILFVESDADEFVQMLMRFWRAAETGTARQNLDLLAKVILGLKRNSTLEFDRFQTFANILETLTRDEILLIGKVFRLLHGNSVVADFKIVKKALADTFDEDQMMGIFAALTRTGLFIPVSAYGGLIYYPTSFFHELCKLAEIKAV